MEKITIQLNFTDLRGLSSVLIKMLAGIFVFSYIFNIPAIWSILIVSAVLALQIYLDMSKAKSAISEDMVDGYQEELGKYKKLFVLAGNKIQAQEAELVEYKRLKSEVQIFQHELDARKALNERLESSIQEGENIVKAKEQEIIALKQQLSVQRDQYEAKLVEKDRKVRNLEDRIYTFRRAEADLKLSNLKKSKSMLEKSGNLEKLREVEAEIAALQVLGTVEQ